MKVVIDNISPGVSTSPQAIGGMRHYLTSLVKAMALSEPGNHYVVTSPRWNAALDIETYSNLRIKPLAGVPKNSLGRVLFEQFLYPMHIQSEKPDVYLGICNAVPVTLAIPTVVVIQATQFFTERKWYGWLRGEYLRRITTWSARRASAVIAVTNAERNEIIQHTGVAAEKVFTVYHGIDEEFQRPPTAEMPEARRRVEAMLGGSRPYLLCVSSFYPNKNHSGLLNGFARMKKLSKLDHCLVLVGGETKAVPRSVLANQASRLGIAQDVIFLGVQPRNVVRDLYILADAMVMPAFAETFGLPVLEAMQMGCPVVTSNSSCLPEIVGTAAELVDPHDAESIAAGIERVLSDDNHRNELRRRGEERAAEFSWKRTATGTLAVLKQAAESRNR